MEQKKNCVGSSLPSSTRKAAAATSSATRRPSCLTRRIRRADPEVSQPASRTNFSAGRGGGDLFRKSWCSRPPSSRLPHVPVAVDHHGSSTDVGETLATASLHFLFFFFACVCCASSLANGENKLFCSLSSRPDLPFRNGRISQRRLCRLEASAMAEI